MRSRVDHRALTGEVYARVRNSQSDLRSGGQGSSSLDKAAEHAQVLGVCCHQISRRDVRDLNSGNEREALRSMAFKRNGGPTSSGSIPLKAKENKIASLRVLGLTQDTT